MNRGTGKTTKALEHLIQVIKYQQTAERFIFVACDDTRNTLNLFKRIFHRTEIDYYDL